MEGVAFDARTHRLAVLDQPAGPGTLVADAPEAAASRRALAAINAGFFTPQGQPLGLVISSGKPSGSWNSSSSLGSGIWCESSGSRMRITRRNSLSSAERSSMRELIQSGPMLVENGQMVSGLDREKSSIRSLVLWDGGTRWWIGRTSFCTLAQLSNALQQESPAPWKVQNALNLDGGRSSDLWISGAVSGGPVAWRTPFNKPVRNFLLLVPR